jgi:hypothetical protein
VRGTHSTEPPPPPPPTFGILMTDGEVAPHATRDSGAGHRNTHALRARACRATLDAAEPCASANAMDMTTWLVRTAAARRRPRAVCAARARRCRCRFARIYGDGPVLTLTGGVAQIAANDVLKRGLEKGAFGVLGTLWLV